MGKPLRLFMTAGDGIGWAIDQDLQLIRRSLGNNVEMSSLEDAHVVFCPWWERLVGNPRTRQPGLPAELLNGKRIICNSPNRPYHEFKDPFYSRAQEIVGRWIVVSSEAKREMESVGIACEHIPYTANPEIFMPIARSAPELAELKQQWRIPSDKYLIGNFFRDTEGGDFSQPKLQKGPDVFLVILRELRRRGLPVHAVLAGPRRFWLMSKLRESEIPFTFVGKLVSPGQDDIRYNIMPRQTLNLLYNILDLSLFPSRWEGGPHGVLEAGLASCKQVSSRVGLAEDILDEAALFRLPHQAVDVISDDISTNRLTSYLEEQRQRVLSNHTPESNASRWRSLLERIEEIPVCVTANRTNIVQPRPRQKWLKRMLSQLLPERRPSVYFHHQFFKPPYGGGNQFMMALAGALPRLRLRVLMGSRIRQANVHLLNSVFFPVDRFRKFAARHPNIKVLHRIDGPIQLYRGFDKELDDQCFALNDEFSHATVLQSLWTYSRLCQLNYRPVRPVVIHNASDPKIFHPRGRIAFSKPRKIKLISTSWSSNPRKGASTFKWLDDNLDWDRFEYTFVGNVEQTFSHIRKLPPMPSKELSQQLRQHDIYINASRNEPCSNALIEALSCGLPAIYYDDGGNPELVGFAGMPFTVDEQIPALLDKLVEHYQMYQDLLQPPSLDEVSTRYAELISDLARED